MTGDKPWPQVPVGNKDHTSAAVVIIGAGISGLVSDSFLGVFHCFLQLRVGEDGGGMLIMGFVRSLEVGFEQASQMDLSLWPTL